MIIKKEQLESIQAYDFLKPKPKSNNKEKNNCFYCLQPMDDDSYEICEECYKTLKEII